MSKFLIASSDDNNDFDLDSDDEAPDEESCDRLNWRLDPSRSLSDWTLRIISRGNHGGNNHGDDADGDNNNDKTVTAATTTTKIDSYHVHRSSLAVGPRRSEYFAALFRNENNFSESSTRTSRIEIDSLAAKSFPQLLDYLYYTGDLELTTETAVPLYFLGKYFEIRPLYGHARQFWQKDLNLTNCDVYYEHARIFRYAKLTKAALNLCRDEFMNVTRSSRICRIADPQLWRFVLEDAPRQDDGVVDEEFSRHLSTLLAEFFSAGDSNFFDAQVFKELTSPDVLPHVHFDAAQTLIELEKKFVDSSSDGASGGGSLVSNLQRRCLEALSEGWERSEMSTTETEEFLSDQSPQLLAKLVSSSLSNASREHGTLRRKADELKTNLDGQTSEATKYKELYDETNTELSVKTAEAEYWKEEHDKVQKDHYDTLKEVQRLRKPFGSRPLQQQQLATVRSQLRRAGAGAAALSDSYQTTPITKHYQMHDQMLSAFESHYEHKLYKVAYAMGMQFVETALLEIPEHGDFYNTRHERERMQSSLEAVRITHLLQVMQNSSSQQQLGQQGGEENDIGDISREDRVRVHKLADLALEHVYSYKDEWC